MADQALGSEPPRRPPQAPPGAAAGGPDYDREDVSDNFAGRARYWRKREKQWSHPDALEKARLFAVSWEDVTDIVAKGAAETYDRGQMAALCYGAAADAWIDHYRAHRQPDRENYELLAREFENAARTVLVRGKLEVSR
ncbi:MAG: hypothetical protein KGL39_10620 [Patescibacteria group bacterium]|nr:hypothetical protein [Patescibacteria group bacterium]